MMQSVNAQALPRRKICELVARYELEPSLRDLFVEGPRDRGIYSWYLKKVGYQGVAVFEIESVEIPHETLVSHGLGSGNRARVIALALEFDDQFPSGLRYARCIADSDFDFVFASRNYSNHVLYTDYTSVDLYTCEDELFRKVLCLGFNVSETEIRSLFDSMLSVLREVFIVRAANQKLDWGMRLVPFTKCCEISGSRVTFDRSDFINRCLDSSSRRDGRSMFEGLCEELQVVHLSDPRQGIHGDDYFELVGWYLKKCRGWSGYRRGERSIMGNLRAGLDDRLLACENLFLELHRILR